MKGWSTRCGPASVDPGVEAKLDATSCAPEGGSTASLKMVLPGGGAKGLGWQNMAEVRCRERLGGLLRYCHREAA